MSKKLEDVTVQLTGGLGNQLFQLAVGFFVAGESPLKLEQDLGQPRRNINGDPDITSFSLPNQVELEPARSPSRFISKVLNYSRRRSAQQNGHGSNILRLGASLLLSIYRASPVSLMGARGLGFCNLEVKDRHPYLLGYFQSYKWLYGRQVLHKMRSIRAIECDEISIFRSLAIKESPLVVHVRLGDYLEHPQFGIPTKSYYENSIQELWNSGDYKKIWLFSNDDSAAMDYIPSHLQELTRVVPEIQKSAASTLEVMRMGCGYVIGNSTYSWWGAMLSNFPNPKIIAPLPWFIEMEEPIDLIPPEWKRQPAFLEEK
jgi:hypothetical protein